MRRTTENYFITNSNEWKNVFPNNTPGNFNISFVLPQAYPFKIRAGISTLLTSKGFFNVLEGACVHVSIAKNDHDVEFISPVLIPPGYYENIETFLETLNASLQILVGCGKLPIVPYFDTKEYKGQEYVTITPVSFSAKVYNKWKDIYEQTEYVVIVDVFQENIRKKLGLSYIQGNGMYQYNRTEFFADNPPDFPSYPYEKLKMY